MRFTTRARRKTASDQEKVVYFIKMGLSTKECFDKTSSTEKVLYP